MEWIKAMPSDSLKSATYLFSEQLRLMLTEPVLAEGTLCSYCHEVMDTQGHHALAARATSFASSIDITAWCRLCTAPSSVLHLSIQAARRGLSSRGAPTALQNCLPLWTAWTLTILTYLATHATSRSATQSARTTFRWSGKGSLHLVPAPRAVKNESGRSLSRRWSAVLLLRQVGLLTSPFILWALT
jgi:hypothetical protein